MHRYADPVFSCKDALAWERRQLIGGEPAEWAAMQRAGRAVAQGIERDALEIGGLPASARLLILVGKGHNGGDALLAAEALLASRPLATATIVPVFGERAFRPLAFRAWQQLVASAPGRINLVNSRGLRERLAAEEHWDLCLDGILGLQFRLPLEADLANLLAALNDHQAFGLRVAVDLPTGVGEESAPVAFRADFTYATGIVKEPVLNPSAAPWVGRLRYADIGFFDAAEPALVHEHVLTVSILDPLRALRPAGCDKRSFGHVLVVAGSRTMPGAALMTVLAALRSGAGLVTSLVPETLVPAFATRAPEAMWLPGAETPDGALALENLSLARPALARASAVVLGPGLGRERETQAFVQGLLALAECPVVLDADALQPAVIECLGTKPSRPIVVTPHAGEFARLRGNTSPRSTALRGGAGMAPANCATTEAADALPHAPAAQAVTNAELLDFALERSVITVLKGPISRLTDGRRVCHSFFGGPVLARGGSGDVLAGLIGGRLASGQGDTFIRVAQGVAWHGLAADRLARHQSATSALATDLLAHLAPVLTEREE
ncbi:MAG: bifunctional ADP-dependent NAD(P)H-hydrate dehydratase/NAD(P)H-hydrate epimerase [Opitutaceae bacterium]|nr:bifunctional ADP-dependent NAD(P)H-hydrate dehydratase/NAD(P)H-hydrate epimerase [Opitutaceae bacterium]